MLSTKILFSLTLIFWTQYCALLGTKVRVTCCLVCFVFVFEWLLMMSTKSSIIIAIWDGISLVYVETAAVSCWYCSLPWEPLSSLSACHSQYFHPNQAVSNIICCVYLVHNWNFIPVGSGCLPKFFAHQDLLQWCRLFRVSCTVNTLMCGTRYQRYLPYAKFLVLFVWQCRCSKIATQFSQLCF